MNQIICTSHSRLNNLETQDTYVKMQKKKSFFKLQFIFLVIVAISLIIYYISFRYDLVRKAELSQSFAQSYRNN